MKRNLLFAAVILFGSLTILASGGGGGGGSDSGTNSDPSSTSDSGTDRVYNYHCFSAGETFTDDTDNSISSVEDGSSDSGGGCFIYNFFDK